MEYKMKPAYKGYKAYEYLEEGKDSPNLSGQTGMGGRHVVETGTRSRRLVLRSCWQKYPYVSVHDHPTLFPKTLPASRISTM